MVFDCLLLLFLFENLLQFLGEIEDKVFIQSKIALAPMIPTEALCVLIEKLIDQFLEIVVVHL